MNEQFFQERYPEGYPKSVDPDQHESVVEIFDGFVAKFADRPAFTCLGQTITYAELNEKSAAFAAYLQNETACRRVIVLPFSCQTSCNIQSLYLVPCVPVWWWLIPTRCTQSVKWSTRLTTQALKRWSFWRTWRLKPKPYYRIPASNM